MPSAGSERLMPESRLQRGVLWQRNHCQSVGEGVCVARSAAERLLQNIPRFSDQRRVVVVVRLMAALFLTAYKAPQIIDERTAAGSEVSEDTK